MNSGENYPPEITSEDLEQIFEGFFENHGSAWPGVVGDSFVMTGPSGTHTLLQVYTDLVRLNAHWRLFASHPLNHSEGHDT